MRQRPDFDVQRTEIALKPGVVIGMMISCR
jgi:hypothetical protein